jgi:hypothetical protein
MTVALRVARPCAAGRLAAAGCGRTVAIIVVAEVPIRIASILSSLAASVALVAAPVALAQTAPEKAAQAKPAATKPAAKSADSKGTKVENATAVRTTPADEKKSSEKSYEGCGGSKMASSDA